MSHGYPSALQLPVNFARWLTPACVQRVPVGSPGGVRCCSNVLSQLKKASLFAVQTEPGTCLSCQGPQCPLYCEYKFATDVPSVLLVRLCSSKLSSFPWCLDGNHVNVVVDDNVTIAGSVRQRWGCRATPIHSVGSTSNLAACMCLAWRVRVRFALVCSVGLCNCGLPPLALQTFEPVWMVTCTRAAGSRFLRVFVRQHQGDSWWRCTVGAQHGVVECARPFSSTGGAVCPGALLQVRRSAVVAKRHW